MGWLISLGASLWMLVCTVIAVRETFDYESTGRAVAVCLIGFIVYLVIALVLGFVLATGALDMTE